MLTMRIFLLTLLSFVLAWNVFAQSPKQPLPQANRAHEAPKPDERGTEQSPVVIKVLPPLNEDEKSATEKQDRKDKSNSDWWLVKLTGVLAAIGVLQLIVFGLQARRLRQTVEEMKIATKATEKAASATEKSVELAREEFIATHRPRLVVRRVGPVEDHGTPTGMQYTVHNVGDTEGTIVAVSEQVWMPDRGKTIPPIPPYSEPIVKTIALKVGDWIIIRHDPPPDVLMDLCFLTGFEENALVDPVTVTMPNMFFVGYIEYIDRIGTKRQTAFLRQLDFGTKRFNPVNHPEYEYQD